jgi:threonine/homoserine/homoserine lactone efflux protein
LFQWVNPKAWALSVSAIAAYTRPDALVTSVLVIAAVFGVVNLPSVATWAVFGAALRQFLSNPAVARAFNVAMALLLVASLYPVVLELVALV